MQGQSETLAQRAQACMRLAAGAQEILCMNFNEGWGMRVRQQWRVMLRLGRNARPSRQRIYCRQWHGGRADDGSLDKHPFDPRSGYRVKLS